MKLKFLSPIPELKPYVTRLWWFENNTGLVNHGTLIVPNARPKIILSVKNAISTTGGGKTDTCTENGIYFIGIRDTPVTLSTAPGDSVSLGIELTTQGAYRFLHTPMSEVANSAYSFGDLYGKAGRDLVEKAANEKGAYQKALAVQAFLLGQLARGKSSDHIVDYCVQMISSLHGLSTIKELERKTGYSKRYLDLLFKKHLGISPKTFATIVRFQRFYRSWADHAHSRPGEFNLYDLYYDQSHFIKEFKRYTGHTPMQLAHFNNDFGRNF